MNDVQLRSEQVIVSSPMSYHGSTVRLWRLRRRMERWHPAARIAVMALALVPAIVLTWVLVTAWYVLFGILLIPYRLLRRGSRKRHRQALQHREMLDAIQRREG